jgi:N-acetyl-gamma-glutamyl-phosphate reductase
MYSYSLTMNNYSVGVLGASGYAGRELCALVAGHPELRLAFATANEQAGATLRLGGRVVPLVAGEGAPLGEVDLVFSALPHGASAEWCARARRTGARVVDLSSDHRPAPGRTAAPYGLTEILRGELRQAPLVANPGCYATGILLALAPLAVRGLLEPGATITVAAASGTTGAGISPRRDLLFSEVVEDFRPYALGNSHRHGDEIRAVLASLGADVDVLFTPHLLPVARGILATIVAPVTADLADPLEPWRAQYEGEPFVELSDEAPSLRDVVRRNVVRIHATKVAGVRRPTLQVIAALDNLVKGAAGQALQNANVMLGVDETLGLPA